MVLLTWGAAAATQAYVDVTSSLGMTVSCSKTKFLVAECDEDRMPLVMGSNTVECVSEFPYLGSLLLLTLYSDQH